LYNAGIFKSYEFNIPILSVGNITVGGTGKTPHVEYLIDVMSTQFKVAVLSRGYKRKTKGFVKADTNSNYTDIGDEPLQIFKKKPEAQVYVCANRVKAVKKIIEEKHEFAPDVILLDDAFQHRKLNPGISILLIDFNRPLEKDYLLPFGLLRENKDGRYRANIIIVTKSPDNMKPIERRIIEKNIQPFPYQSLYFSKICYGELTPFLNERQISKNEYGEYDVLLVTGIADNTHLMSYMDNRFSRIFPMFFPDHHAFNQKNIESIIGEFNKITNRKKIVITTEKDYIRLIEYYQKKLFIDLPLYYLPITIEFFENESEKFNNQIINYVRKNQRNNQLHQKQSSF
jgi:tetraacyldisaccharide 4'-kinase